MNLLLTFLILSAAHEAPMQERHPDAVEVFHCDFGESTDVNYDGWPDGWTRRRDPDHPGYLNIEIADDKDAIVGRTLRVQLDGGAATIYSPPIEVSPLFSYVLEGRIRTEGLKHNVAYYSLTFFDAEKRPLGTFYSTQVRDIRQWEKTHIGPVTPNEPDIRLAVIGLHLEPTSSADLTGEALFDDVWLARLPRMTLHSNSDHNVYNEPGQVEITCEVSGILERDPLMTFELIDISSRKLASMANRLEGEVVALKRSRASVLFGSGESLPKGDVSGFRGTMKWKPPIETYGFYRVRVNMEGRTGLMHTRSITLAVVRPQPSPTGGEFGWSLPQGDDPLELGTLASLVGQMGVNWVKFPVWYSEQDNQRADRLAWFAERLNSQRIEMVGMLDQPPDDIKNLFGDADRLLAANVFAERELWYPVLDPVMTRLSLKVRWWQLGQDRDTSFVGYPQLERKIGEVRKQLERFGQEIHLGIAWQWLHAPPEPEHPPWEFLANTIKPSFTQEELSSYLEVPAPKGVKRWVVLEPLPCGAYPIEQRASDLVGRMLAAKMGGADAVFIPDPFDPQTGLMNPDGTPAELLLPWRTSALMLSGTHYVGSIRMPQGSHNYVMARDGQTVMVVWNERPVKELIYLGEDIEQIDLWGRITRPIQKGHQQEIDVGPLPTFILHVNEPITRLRMDFAFDRAQLTSIYGRPQELSFRVKNFFGQGVGGEVTLHTPEVWETHPKTIRLKLAAGEELVQPFSVLLRSDANSGPQDIRIDFDITADRNYKFSVYRTIEVGEGDVLIEYTSHLNAKGELIVEQHLINKTDQFVSFKCLLYIPDRRPVRQQVLNLARGRDTKVFVLPRGEELVGKQLWLRAEEIGGERILNYRFTADH